MASGTSRVVRGSFVGTGSAKNIRTVGFRPRTVKLWNVTGLVSAVWLDTMADAAAVKAVTDGTQSYITSDGITPLSDGFTCGADADINASAEIVHWEATE
jgi:hypothetical protein